MELPDLKPDLHRTLLGPLSLATEIVGALLPGCVFTILLCVKRRWVTAILSYPLLGYKTKVVVALFASYIVGKLILSTITLAIELGEWIGRRLNRLRTPAPPKKDTNLLEAAAKILSNTLDQAPDSLRALLGGLVAGSLLACKFQILEEFSAFQAGTVFHLSTGVALLLSAAIPGDGKFRFLELLAGAILFARGVKSWHKHEVFAAGALGIVLNNYLSGLQPGQLSTFLKTAWAVASSLSKTPVPDLSKTPASDTTKSPAPNSSGLSTTPPTGAESAPVEGK